jgi:hypothetical protein
MYEITKKINVELPEFLNSNYDASNYMILDIETTGLSRTYDQVILVGFIYNENNQWYITQLFCDHRKEEKKLLEKLTEYIRDDHLLITYNGHAFDIPFLNQRYQHHQMNYKLSTEKHFDLYRVVRASKKSLNLDNYKLKSIELFLGIERTDEISGKESVELYELYEYSRSKELKNKICLHNYEDILLMIPTLKILNYIPENITYKYFPIYHLTSLGGCYLNTFISTHDYIELTIYVQRLLKPWVDYRLGLSFKCDRNLIHIKVPIFTLQNHKFIDIDLLPFYSFPFNSLKLEQQLALELKSNKESFMNIIKLLDQYYFQELT